MLLRQLSKGTIFASLIGFVLIGVAIVPELRATTSDGIGPYQAILIILGILIILLGVFPSGHILSKLALMSVSFAVSLIIIEGVLLLLSRANVVVTYPDTRELLDDRLLGKRTPQGAVGHDARGWRNEIALPTADIVIVGDSQTWGVNATLEENYPSVLSQLTGYSVYSMAQGSYGAVQYRVLAEQAIELSPQLVVVGMYFGNDFADAYSIVYGDYEHQKLRDPSFDLTSITQTIAEQAEALQPDRLANFNQQSERVDPSELTFIERVQSGTYIGKFLTTLGVFDAVDTGAVEQRMLLNRELVAEFPALFAQYRDNNVETFFTPAYRQRVVDIDSPIIREGIRISKVEYITMENMLSDAEIEFLVVLIPTKELIYAPYIDELNDAYLLLVEQEAQIRNEMIAVFEENDIAYVDMLPALRAEIEDGVAIYPATFDGHPNHNGYRVIAEQLAEFIGENAMMQ